MEYKHPEKYEGIRNQSIAKVMVNENCLKCEKFCGQEHDFSECKPLFEKCFDGFKCPPLIHTETFL